MLTRSGYFVLRCLSLGFTFGITESPCSRQIMSLSLCNAIPENQKSRNFRSHFRLVELKMMWLWICARSTWVATINSCFPFVNLMPVSYPTSFASSGVISPGLKDWRIWYAITSCLGKFQINQLRIALIRWNIFYLIRFFSIHGIIGPVFQTPHHTPAFILVHTRTITGTLR